MIRKGHELFRGLDDVFFGEKRLPSELFAPFHSLLRKVFLVPGLDPGRIHHDEGSDVSGRRGGVDVSSIAFFRKKGKEPCMIVMAVGQHHGGHRFRLLETRPIFFLGFLAFALESPAVDLEEFAVHVKKVAGTRNLPGGSPGKHGDAHISIVV